MYLTKYFIVLMIIESFTTTLASGCDNTWLEFNIKCYKLFNMDEYFITAEAICQKENGKLTSLTTIEENSFVNQLVQNGTNFQEAWIGLQIDNSGGQTWTDKSVVDYTNFMFKRPVLSSKGCAIIIPGGRWADITCYHLRPFVCEKDPKKEEVDDNVELILTIAIPLSCVFVMSTFVCILCVHSHRELKQLRKEIPEDKSPFDVIQSTMTLPTQIPKTLGTINGNGKNLWIDAIEKIKSEQLNNNPLHKPETFLQRNLQEEKNNNNNNNDVYSDIHVHRNSLFENGLIGAPDIELKPLNHEILVNNINDTNGALYKNDAKIAKNLVDDTNKKKKKIEKSASHNSFFKKISLNRKRRTSKSEENEEIVVNKFALKHMKSDPAYLTKVRKVSLNGASLKRSIPENGLVQFRTFTDGEGYLNSHSLDNNMNQTNKIGNGSINIFKIHDPKDKKQIKPPKYLNKELNGRSNGNIISMNNSKELSPIENGFPKTENKLEEYNFKEILRSESFKQHQNIFPRYSQNIAGRNKTLEITKL